MAIGFGSDWDRYDDNGDTARELRKEFEQYKKKQLKILFDQIEIPTKYEGIKAADKYAEKHEGAVGIALKQGFMDGYNHFLSVLEQLNT